MCNNRTYLYAHIYRYIVLPYNTRPLPSTQVKLKRAVFTRDPPERTNRVNWPLRKRRNIKTDKIVFDRKRPGNRARRDRPEPPGIYKGSFGRYHQMEIANTRPLVKLTFRMTRPRADAETVRVRSS